MDDMYDIRGRKRGANWTTMNRIIMGESVNRGCLYQGGWLAAGDLDRMRDHNMGLVINCTINVEDPPWINHPDAPRYLRFPIVNGNMWNAYDSNSTLESLQGLFARVDETLRCQNVMVQCRAGIHRAGTMATILCMRLLHLTPQDAIRHVRHKRAGTQIMGGCLAMVQQVFAEMERSRTPLPAAPAAPGTPPKAAPRVRLNPAPLWPPPELARAAAKADPRPPPKVAQVAAPPFPVPKEAAPAARSKATAPVFRADQSKPAAALAAHAAPEEPEFVSWTEATAVAASKAAGIPTSAPEAPLILKAH